MKVLQAFLAFLFAAVGFAQNLQGVVLDAGNTPLPGANVYFDNSSIATITDSEGNFSFVVNTKVNLSLVVSYVGYKTQYIQDYDLGKKLIVVLEEEQNKLKEVTVTGNQLFSRKEKLKIFREQFLGVSKAARKAVIANEDDIYFVYDKSSNTLQGFADKPLIIENPYLGYQITYELVRFELAFKKTSISSSDISSIFYSGYSRFEETGSDKEILQRREESYLGSTLHFFRSLASDSLFENKFVLYKEGLARNPADCFVITDSDGMKNIKVNKVTAKDTEIFYNILYNDRERSRLTFKTDQFLIDYLGNYSSLERIFFLGEFGSKRVGNQLPLNYGIK
ncbi:MAG TPA: carboxypeptidase-like regulatory domain-containing protein [Flavobacterium sp.]|jgi:hypothetical protein|nr:carboxypeptidase-like regulatory domain-containing protein [Flavobacterium sp.]HPJ09670.1 carboxypeptidase-like regulatory domain-containing protein [Flavobacterium sp.]